MGKKGVEPYASYLKLGEGAEIPESRFLRDPNAQPLRAGEVPPKTDPAAKPVPRSEMGNSIEVVVVGGGTNTYWSGGDFSHVTSIAVDKWR
jgi:hypothetical protein